MKILAVCLLLISTSSWGADSCTRNSMKVDVCRVATTLSQTIAPELPLRLNQSLVLQHIGAAKNLIRMRAVLDYTKGQLMKASRTGAALDTMKTTVRDTAIVMACRPKTELQAFIELGGELQFVYLFADGAHFLTVDVDHCTLQPGTKAFR